MRCGLISIEAWIAESMKRAASRGAKKPEALTKIQFFCYKQKPS